MKLQGVTHTCDTHDTLGARRSALHIIALPLHVAHCILNEESACDGRHGDVVEVAEDMMMTKTKRATTSPGGPTECKDGNVTARVSHNTLCAA